MRLQELCQKKMRARVVFPLTRWASDDTMSLRRCWATIRHCWATIRASKPNLLAIPSRTDEVAGAADARILPFGGGTCERPETFQRDRQDDEQLAPGAVLPPHPDIRSQRIVARIVLQQRADEHKRREREGRPHRRQIGPALVWTPQRVRQAADGAVTAGVSNWAEEGNSDAIPAGKLGNAPAGSGSLDQAAVDARVVHGVVDWAESGNTDQVPSNKLGNVPAAGLDQDAAWKLRSLGVVHERIDYDRLPDAVHVDDL